MNHAPEEPDDQPSREIDALCDEQRRRWKSGDRVSVETLLKGKENLWKYAEALTDLVFHEYLLHEEFGPPPMPEDFIKRFPNIEAQLKRQFALHAGLSQSGSSPPAESLPPDTREVIARRLLAGESLEGCRIRAYEVGTLLGRGGFGVVYRGQHATLGRSIALKFTIGKYVGDADARRRFLEEARTAANLRHDHIVKLFDVLEEEHFLCLVYEYCPGPTLAQWMAERNSVTPETAARILRPIADAVHDAHTQGIFHRDIKPGNILLDTDRNEDGLPFRPKLTDFGLARSTVPTGNGDSGDSFRIVGSLRYMPPEQARGERPTSPAGDVYALGAVLFELLTGRPANDGEKPSEILGRLQAEPSKPPQDLEPSIPDALKATCLKCLARDPSDRYSSAAALSKDLQRFLSNESVATKLPSPKPGIRRWFRERFATSTLTVGCLFAAVFAALAAVSAPAEHTRENPPAVPGKEPVRKLIRIGTVWSGGELLTGLSYVGNGRWYAASDGGRVYLFDGFQIPIEKKLSVWPTRDVAVDRRTGNLLASAQPPGSPVRPPKTFDLYKFDSEGKRPRLLIPSKHAIVGLDIEHARRRLWIAYRNGRIENRTLEGKLIRSLKQSYQNVIGLSVDKDGKNLLILSAATPPSDRIVRVAVETEDREILLPADEIELDAGGIERHKPSGTVYVTYVKSHWLSSLIVFARNPAFTRLVSVDDVKLGNPRSEAENERITRVGNSAVTRDTKTGLEWLDLRYTKNMAVVDVEAELKPGGRFAGFRYATFNEVQILYAAAGLARQAAQLKGDAFRRLTDLQKLLGIGKLKTSERWDVTGLTGDTGVQQNERKATQHVCDFTKRQGSIDTTLSLSRNIANGQTAHWLVRKSKEAASAAESEEAEEDGPTFWQRCWFIAAICSLVSGILAALVTHHLGRGKMRPTKDLSDHAATAD